MSVNHPVLLLIFLLIFKTGFSDVFVQTGASVQLDIQELPKTLVLTWRKDESATIVTFITAAKQEVPESSYEERVQFNNETFSLTLKNMMKTDSGLYTARAVEDNNKYFAKYKVSVIDAVEAPVLTVNSKWSSSDSCTVNFTCRAHELMINSTYQNNRCSPEEVTSHEIHTLSLDCSEKSIICNHSNPVSWKQDRINIEELCLYKEESSKQSESSLLWRAGVGVGVLVAVVILVLVLILYRKYKKGAQEAAVDVTLYSQVQAREMRKLDRDIQTYDIPDRVQAHTQEETGDKLPNTTYCKVGQYQKPAIKESETDRTIYSEVCKQPNKKPPAISPDDS